MKDINFFSSFIKKANKKQSKLAWVIFIIIILGGIITGGYLLADSALNDLRAEVQKFKDEAGTQPAQEALIKNLLIQAYREYNQYIDLVDKSFAAQTTLKADYMKAIAVSIPDSVYLETLTIEGTDGNLTGVATSNLSVGQFCSNLQRSGYFENAAIDDISKNEAGTFTFSVSLSLKGGEGE